jgi:hypothetical protein
MERPTESAMTQKAVHWKSSHAKHRAYQHTMVYFKEALLFCWEKEKPGVVSGALDFLLQNWVGGGGGANISRGRRIPAASQHFLFVWHRYMRWELVCALPKGCRLRRELKKVLTRIRILMILYLLLQSKRNKYFFASLLFSPLPFEYPTPSY